MTAAFSSTGTGTASRTTAPTAPWIGRSTRHLFFTGKGGVGKTTVASATALRFAEAGRQTLLVSTDPASNLDDVFEMRCGIAPTAVPGVPALWIMNLDPEQAAAAYRENLIAPYRGILPDTAVRSMEEQLSGACTVEIAAFNEFTSLLADLARTQHFERVIFDTAPTGHTLRLLSLPSAWSDFLAASGSGAACLGPLAGLEAHRERYAAAVTALADPLVTTLILVTRPEASALREAGRAGAELAGIGICNQRVVVNGVLTGDDRGDPIAAAFIARQSTALASMPASLRSAPSARIPLIASSLTGLKALRAFARAAESAQFDAASVLSETVSGMTMPAETESMGTRDEFGNLDALVQRIIADGHGLVMTMGKGGVGKTTLAATLALAIARAGHRVHLSTTDPAAHVAAAVGDTAPATLTVSRIDPAAETERYATEVLAAAQSGAADVGGIDASERALLEEDLRSPCTEEIAVFRAFARTVANATDAFVVLDTAPTGHTLLLLDAAEAYHREIARTSGAHIPDAVRTLLPRLRDPVYTKMLLVTLAESTPVQEASRLQDDLRRAGIEPFGWVVNACLAASGTTHPTLAARARLERPALAHVADRLARQLWIVPWVASA